MSSKYHYNTFKDKERLRKLLKLNQFIIQTIKKDNSFPFIYILKYIACIFRLRLTPILPKMYNVFLNFFMFTFIVFLGSILICFSINVLEVYFFERRI